ncbi:MAG: hypothetical protein KF745_13040 [Phycisphaeraceae bacterium]|nr:hypothetical protein [Phycisphaeraceae bacterium]
MMGGTVAAFARYGVIGVAAGVLSAMWPAPAAAQQGQPARGGNANRVEPATRAAEMVISLKFPGGTLSEYVKAIQAAAPGNVNIMVSSDAASMMVPPTEMKGVAVSSALEVLPMMARAEGRTAYVQTVGDVVAGTGVYSVASKPNFIPQPMPQSPFPAPGPETAVFSVRELTNPVMDRGAGPGVPIESVLTAIDAAAQLAGAEAEQPQIRYHKDSGVLIVRALPQQLTTIKSILQTMQGDIVDRRVAAMTAAERQRDRAKAVAAAQRALERAMDDIRRSEGEFARAREAANEFAKRVEAGVAPTDELTQARALVQRRLDTLESARLKMRQAEAELEDVTAVAAAERESLGVQVMVYDVEDMMAAMPELVAACQAVVAHGDAVNAEQREIIVRAAPGEQAAVSRVLTAIRRVKGNDPNLPEVNGREVTKKDQQPQ